MLYCLRNVSIQYKKDTYDKTIVLYKMNEWKFKLELEGTVQNYFRPQETLSGILCKGLTYLLFW